MKEREISLIDLMFEILLKWRIIVVAMIIGAVLLGGYSHWQSAKTINEQQSQNGLKGNNVIETQEELFARLENTLTEVQKNNVKTVVEYEEYNEYYDNSVLMQVDANSVPTTNLIFSAETQNEKDKVILVSVYAQIIENGIVQWLIENGMDYNEAAKAAELVTVKTDMGSQVDVLLSSTKGIVTVSVVHSDEAKCKELAEAIKNLVIAKEEALEALYGEIEVVLVDEFYATEMNMDILTKQRTIFTNVVAGNANIDKLKTAFTPDETTYYEILKDDITSNEADAEVPETETTPAPVVIPSPSVNVKLVIIGMLAFAFLYVFFVFVMYLFNNKLRATDSMAELYDITEFGVVSTVGGKKKFLGFIDNLIIKLRDRNKRKFTKEEAEEIVAVAIKMAVRKSETNEVSLVGCEVKKQTEDICNNIKALLEKEDITVTILDNVLYNAETLEKLENTKNAVLVEKVGSTMYDEVAKEIELLQRNKINVLGGILVE